MNARRQPVPRPIQCLSVSSLVETPASFKIATICDSAYRDFFIPRCAVKSTVYLGPAQGGVRLDLGIARAKVAGHPNRFKIEGRSPTSVSPSGQALVRLIQPITQHGVRPFSEAIASAKAAVRFDRLQSSTSGFGKLTLGTLMSR